MSQSTSGFIAALYQLSLKSERVSLVRFISALIAETIYAFEWKSIPNEDDKVRKLIIGKIKGHKYNKLKKYNRESLNLYIERNWNYIDHYSLLPKGDKCWAYEYNANTKEVLLQGYLSKRDTNESYRIDLQCGDNEYILEDKKQQDIKNVENIKNTQSYDEGKKEEIREKVCSMINKLKSLYDELVDVRGEKVNSYEYIWQWLISDCEYEKISDTFKCKFLKKEQLLSNKKQFLTL